MAGPEVVIGAALVSAGVGSVVTHRLTVRRTIRDSEKEVVALLEDALTDMKLHADSWQAPWPATSVQDVVSQGQRTLIRAEGRLGRDHPIPARVAAAMGVFNLAAATATGHGDTFGQCLELYFSDGFAAMRAFHQQRRVSPPKLPSVNEIRYLAAEDPTFESALERIEAVG